MAQVTVIINNRRYDIACDDGEEAHLTRLAQDLDKRVNELTRAVGQIGDSLLLVMASLLVADELSEANTELDALRGDGKGTAADQAVPELERLADRIEAIAEKLEQS
ncbi:MAG: cell division protein ZapA [Rhodospirillales bacterium]|nr:cell division protein ZapA [Rhodospirillales bacterium]